MTDLARAAALETSARAALPALEERRVGGWLLRASGGDTKRVNSANPLDPAVSVAAMRPIAERFYAERSLPSRFRLTPLARPDTDALLGDAGYARVDLSRVMTAALVARPTDPAVNLCDRATPEAIALGEQLSSRSPAAAAIQARLLAAIAAPIALATIADGGAVVASGYASIGDGRAQLSDIVVAPDARGRGFGRRLVAGLLGWAHGQGCREATLQVLESNIVARGLYRSLGFTDAYPYHYRVRA